MKTKLTLLLTALAMIGGLSTATAGPDMLTLELRKQIADSQRAARIAVNDSGPVHYVASPSGKGGTVARTDGATSIAVFKSKSTKMAGCSDAACCAKAKSHTH